MRIWNVPPRLFDRQHLLGEHYEIHSAVTVLISLEKGIKTGFQKHPQVLRFKGHLGQLYDRHHRLVIEMRRRGYKHKTVLPDFEYTPERYRYSLKGFCRDICVLFYRQTKPVFWRWFLGIVEFANRV